MENETLQLKYTYAQIDAQKAALERNKAVTFALVIVILVGTAFFYRNHKLMKKLRLSKDELQARHRELSVKEEETQAALKCAEEANRVKTSFLNSITHEVRTPLNSIVGFVQLLKPSDEEEKVMVDEICANSFKLVRLMDNAIELSDYDTVSRDLERMEVNVHACCMASLEQISLSLHPGVSVRLISDDEALTIRTNEQAFYRLLNCLLSNASKFTEAGSIELDYRKEGQLLYLYVQDTGKGIPIDRSEWVFERFTKIDSFVPGYGLGLPLARAIVHCLGGTVTLDTAYVGGSRFIIVLPLRVD